MLNSLKLRELNPNDVVRKAGDFDSYAADALYDTNKAFAPQRKTYESLNPKNKVLANGIFFNNLFNAYMSILNADFKDLRLQTKTAFTDRVMISASEYKALPKQIRGLFMQYDYDNYVLHSNDEPHYVLSVKQKDKAELRSLLEKARILLPVIYKTKWRENAPELTQEEHNKKWLNRTIGRHFTEPDIAPNSLRSRFVSDIEIDAIEKLRAIFVRLGEITTIHKCDQVCYEKTPKDKKVAREEDREYIYKPTAATLYKEYKDGLTQQGRYLRAQHAIDRVSAKGITTLVQVSAPENRSGLLALAEYTKRNYGPARQQIINDMRSRIK
jgi:Zn-finger nucleic acid-binding protein